MITVPQMNVPIPVNIQIFVTPHPLLTTYCHPGGAGMLFLGREIPILATFLAYLLFLGVFFTSSPFISFYWTLLTLFSSVLGI